MKKILIVDDDLALLEILEASLQYSNYSVKAMDFCPDILEQISIYEPDLVILDYVLAGTNGGEMCNQIKNNPSTSTLPVIIITAYPKALDSAVIYHSNAILPKPFDLSELLLTIEACIADPSASVKKF